MTNDLQLGMFLYGVPLQLIRRFTAKLDAAGFDGAWYPEITYNDAFTPIAMAGVESKRLKKLGTAVIGPWARSPVVTALSAATLQEATGGRLVLGLGTQAKPYVNHWHGRNYERPLRAMREYIDIVKGILRGGLFSYAGEIFHVENFELTYPPAAEVPIYMAAIGPKMLELAGEIADGAIGVFWSTAYVRDVAMPAIKKGLARSGRSIEDFQIVLSMSTLVTPADSALELQRGQFMQYACADQSSPFYAESVIKAGFGNELKELRSSVAAQDYSRAFQIIRDDMVDALTLSGTATHIGERMNEYQALGIDEIHFIPVEPGAYHRLYEGHLPGAAFPEHSAEGYIAAVDQLITNFSR